MAQRVMTRYALTAFETFLVPTSIISADLSNSALKLLLLIFSALKRGHLAFVRGATSDFSRRLKVSERTVHSAVAELVQQKRLVKIEYKNQTWFGIPFPELEGDGPLDEKDCLKPEEVANHWATTDLRWGCRKLHPSKTKKKFTKHLEVKGNPEVETLEPPAKLPAFIGVIDHEGVQFSAPPHHLLKDQRALKALNQEKTREYVPSSDPGSGEMKILRDDGVPALAFGSGSAAHSSSLEEAEKSLSPEAKSLGSKIGSNPASLEEKDSAESSDNKKTVTKPLPTIPESGYDGFINQVVERLARRLGRRIEDAMLNVSGIPQGPKYRKKRQQEKKPAGASEEIPGEATPNEIKRHPPERVAALRLMVRRHIELMHEYYPHYCTTVMMSGRDWKSAWDFFRGFGYDHKKCLSLMEAAFQYWEGDLERQAERFVCPTFWFYSTFRLELLRLSGVEFEMSHEEMKRIEAEKLVRIREYEQEAKQRG